MFFCLSCQTGPGQSEFNLDLEKQSVSGALPDGRFVWGSDCRLTVVTAVKHSGHQSVYIKPSGSGARLQDSIRGKDPGLIHQLTLADKKIFAHIK